MKLLALIFVLVAGAFASEEKCPPNQHYNDCGTMCPVTCENYEDPPVACFLMCYRGCECDDGYVKARDGSCIKKEECPGKEVKNCVDKPEAGMCRGNFPMWYYDDATRECKEFIYGGCQGNGNRYSSRKLCIESCVLFFPSPPAQVVAASSDRCDLPADAGLCKGYFRRFHFDKATGQCKKFIYGGCGGNENNFHTGEECQSACGNRAPQVCGENEHFNRCGTDCPLTCENYDNPPKFCNLMCRIGCECENGFVRRADGKCVRPEQCPNRQAALDRPDCEKAPETGLCDAYFLRYYYDEVAGQCKQFVYGGCGGNRNNFKTEEECYNKCGALHAKARNACEEEKEVGSCKAAFARFYFNKHTGHCEPFIYGGCDGNSNNFLTIEDCEDVCVY